MCSETFSKSAHAACTRSHYFHTPHLTHLLNPRIIARKFSEKGSLYNLTYPHSKQFNPSVFFLPFFLSLQWLPLQYSLFSSFWCSFPPPRFKLERASSSARSHTTAALRKLLKSLVLNIRKLQYLPLHPHPHLDLHLNCSNLIP